MPEAAEEEPKRKLFSRKEKEPETKAPETQAPQTQAPQSGDVTAKNVFVTSDSTVNSIASAAPRAPSSSMPPL